jgi:hypothetical protein
VLAVGQNSVHGVAESLLHFRNVGRVAATRANAFARDWTAQRRCRPSGEKYRSRRRKNDQILKIPWAEILSSQLAAVTVEARRCQTLYGWCRHRAVVDLNYQAFAVFAKTASDRIWAFRAV